MALTVNQSWRMRKNLVTRIRTFKQAKDIWKFSACTANEAASKAGGYHLSLGDCRTRQYPLLMPHWSRTYVGKLDARVNASRLDNTMYTSNDQVPAGRIAFYYAPAGGYGRNNTTLSHSMEVVLWLPDGRCLINPSVMEEFQWGRRYRAENFADVSLMRIQGQSCIRTKRGPDGDLPGIWIRKPKPLSGLPLHLRNSYHEILDNSGNKTGMYHTWVKDYSNLNIWGRHTPLVVPKNRQQRPYVLRGVADHSSQAFTSPEIPRLTSWNEERAERKKIAAIHRKMAGLMRTMRNAPEHLRYFVQNYRNQLGIEERRAPTAVPVPTPIPATVEFLEAGNRHKRRVFLDEQDTKKEESC